MDLSTHTLFIAKIKDKFLVSDKESATYSYYHAHIKPQPTPKMSKGWVCKVCGYLYEGDILPDNFLCPICNHGVADFEKL